MGFSGLGWILRFSTMFLIGLKVLLANLEARTFHVSRHFIAFDLVKMFKNELNLPVIPLSF